MQHLILEAYHVTIPGNQSKELSGLILKIARLTENPSCGVPSPPSPAVSAIRLEPEGDVSIIEVYPPLANHPYETFQENPSVKLRGDAFPCMLPKL